MTLTREDILSRLRERDENRLAELWRMADDTRRSRVGDAVHLRGLVEFSNYCRRQCAYCGIRAGNSGVTRYRMTASEVLDCVRLAESLGYGTVVLQSGEDPGISAEWLAEVIRSIKKRTALAVTLSVGERSEKELRLWRQAGADRYLLRFETSNPDLYRRIHPTVADGWQDRMEILRLLRRIGYEVGSGVMVGIPGQTWAILADDILAFAGLDLDMIGVGPYIPHPATPLACAQPAGEDQAANDELTTLKVVALARLVCPNANIPSTTALATIDPKHGRELGLSRGANIVMPNVTPLKYRTLYEIYPGKACVSETAEACSACLRGRIAGIGRTVGAGRGDSANKLCREGARTE